MSDHLSLSLGTIIPLTIVPLTIVPHTIVPLTIVPLTIVPLTIVPPIGSSGYIVYKYMPYGPVDEVVTYLIRRAHENKGMLAGAVRERDILAKELKRRLVNR